MREPTPSLLRMLATWVLTVRRPIESASAISGSDSALDDQAQHLALAGAQPRRRLRRGGSVQGRARRGPEVGRHLDRVRQGQRAAGVPRRLERVIAEGGAGRRDGLLIAEPGRFEDHGAGPFALGLGAPEEAGGELHVAEGDEDLGQAQERVRDAERVALGPMVGQALLVGGDRLGPVAHLPGVVAELVQRHADVPPIAEAPKGRQGRGQQGGGAVVVAFDPHPCPAEAPLREGDAPGVADRLELGEGVGEDRDRALAVVLQVLGQVSLPVDDNGHAPAIVARREPLQGFFGVVLRHRILGRTPGEHCRAQRRFAGRGGRFPAGRPRPIEPRASLRDVVAEEPEPVERAGEAQAGLDVAAGQRPVQHGAQVRQLRFESRDPGDLAGAAQLGLGALGQRPKVLRMGPANRVFLAGARQLVERKLADGFEHAESRFAEVVVGRVIRRGRIAEGTCPPVRKCLRRPPLRARSRRRRHRSRHRG